jgi:hypothetical protein
MREPLRVLLILVCGAAVFFLIGWLTLRWTIAW